MQYTEYLLSDIVVLGHSYNKLSRSAALVLLPALTGTQNNNPKNNMTRPNKTILTRGPHNSAQIQANSTSGVFLVENDLCIAGAGNARRSSGRPREV